MHMHMSMALAWFAVFTTGEYVQTPGQCHLEFQGLQKRYSVARAAAGGKI